MQHRAAALAWLLVLFGTVNGCSPDSRPTATARIQDIFREAHAGGFNGNVLVTRGDAVLFQGSFGLADEARRLPNTAATRFLAFSLNKPMTAVLVFQQVEAGKLRLDDRLSDVFANLEGTPAGAITIGQLLRHTSGIEEVISLYPDRRITAGDLATAEVRQPGGTRYSNTGFVVLALVIEQVTGRSYREVMQQRIFDPAGMRDSGLLRSGVGEPGLATGYRSGRGREPHALGIPPEVIEGAGSLYTTIGDLARFDRALATGKLLSDASLEAMLQRANTEQAFGWSMAEQGGQYFPWHQGSFRGFSAVFVRQIHRGEMIAILSNDHEADVLDLRTKVLRVLKDDSSGR
jgi:CubicO group peptidase (beta-lactamase class C family)